MVNCINSPNGLAYDAANNRLFVANGGNNRVTVYDVGSITNGENAIHVLGQPDFTTGTAATTQAGMNSPQGLAFDPRRSVLFSCENFNHRVLELDVTAEVPDFMALFPL